MTDADELKQHYLFPGNLFANSAPHLITTVLGSCVSVCLWDKDRQMGGMNHYMLPLWNGEGLASPKYGNIAIPKLIEHLLELGSRKTSLRAKVFGGGEVLRVTKGILNVGERNIVLAKELLKESGIPIVSSDLGGPTGRKIIFNTKTGAVLMKRLKSQVDDIRIIKPNK